MQAGKLSALGQMSAGISHELNQPLMAIRSFAENAVQFMERGKPERAADNLDRISDMARRMGRIIKNLRAFSKQESEPVRAHGSDLGADRGGGDDADRAERMDGVTLHYDAARTSDLGAWRRGASGAGLCEPDDQCARCDAGRARARVDHRP